MMFIKGFKNVWTEIVYYYNGFIFHLFFKWLWYIVIFIQYLNLSNLSWLPIDKWKESG